MNFCQHETVLYKHRLDARLTTSVAMVSNAINFDRAQSLGCFFVAVASSRRRKLLLSLSLN